VLEPRRHSSGILLRIDAYSPDGELLNGIDDDNDGMSCDYISTFADEAQTASTDSFQHTPAPHYPLTFVGQYLELDNLILLNDSDSNPVPTPPTSIVLSLSLLALAGRKWQR